MIFGWNIFSILIPSNIVEIYFQIMIIGIGIVAIVWQKKLHKEKFLDMGFRINKNILYGLSIGIVYIIIQFLLNYWLPYQLGFTELEINPNLDSNINLFFLITQTLIIHTLLMFPLSLFGEELAWRGYILPKLKKATNKSKAIILNAILFSMWHIPVFFSLYLGGAATQGLIFLVSRLILIVIAVIPLNILCLNTRELYVVSLLHALSDVFDYYIFGDPALGVSSQKAIYHVITQNEIMFQTMLIVAYILGTLFMLLLCRLGKKFFNNKEI